MERKMRLLDAEYEACVRATRTDHPSRTDADAEQQFGQLDAEVQLPAHDYKPFGFVPASASPAAPGPDDDEWGEAWSDYQRVVAEEKAEQEQRQKNGEEEAEEEVQQEDKPPLHKPLTPDSVASIKSIMAGVRVAPPFWARGLSESEWGAQILARAGLAARAKASAAVTTQGSTPDDDKKKKDKIKKKKKSKAKKEEQGKEAAEAADSTHCQSSSAAEQPQS